MRIIYQQDYLSISKFNDVELPDFTVLTGVNGSGKSHFMQSIENGKEIVEDMDTSGIVYFNYETFRLENESLFNAYQLATEREGAWNLFESQVKSNILSWKNDLGDDYKPMSYLAMEKNKNFWYLQKKDLSNEEQYKKLNQYKKNITNFFRTNNNLINNPQARSILSLIKNIPYSIDEISKGNFYNLYRPYDFKNDFLPQYLGKAIGDYYFRYARNFSNEYQNAKYGKNLPCLSEKDFIKTHGTKPWILVNTILKKFNSLDFKISSPEEIDPFESYILELIHTKKSGLKISFTDLSSGERILMALVASVYKASSDNHFPTLLLLDEVDASLHPSMIQNMIDVVKEIFLEKGTKIILVTHSPTTVALAPEESIFVMNKDGENRVEKRSKEDALSILTEGFASLTQGESDLSISYNVSKAPSSVIFTEGITDKIIIETAWKKLFPKNQMPFYVQDCFDASFLRNLFNRGGDTPDGIFIKYSDRQFIALFDFDEEGYQCWNNLKGFSINSQLDPMKGLAKKHKFYSASGLLIPVPKTVQIKSQVIKSKNTTYKDRSHLPIELMFYGVSSLENNFSEENASGGGKIIKFVGDKRRFAENCKNLVAEDFENFKAIFESINTILKSYDKTK